MPSRPRVQQVLSWWMSDHRKDLSDFRATAQNASFFHGIYNFKFPCINGGSFCCDSVLPLLPVSESGSPSHHTFSTMLLRSLLLLGPLALTVSAGSSKLRVQNTIYVIRSAEAPSFDRAGLTPIGRQRATTCLPNVSLHTNPHTLSNPSQLTYCSFSDPPLVMRLGS